MQFINFKLPDASSFLIIIVILSFDFSLRAQTVNNRVAVQNALTKVQANLKATETATVESKTSIPADQSPDKTKTTFPATTGDEPTAVNQPQIDGNTLRHLSLEKATDLLIQNNLPTVAARYNVSLAQAQRSVAGLRPAASVTVSATQFAVPRVFTQPKNLFSTNNNAAANVTYTIEYDRLLERGGKRQYRIAQADFNAQAAEALVQDTIRQQVFSLKQAFLNALLARENYRLATNNLGTFEKSEKILYVQVKEGYSAGVDLKRIQLQELQFQTAVVSSEQSYQQATRDVFNLIGVGDAPSLVNNVEQTNYDVSALAPRLEANLDVVDGDLQIVPVVLWINDLRRMALENRPDVKAAKLNLEAARANIRIAQAQQNRDITIGGQYSRSGSDNSFGVVATIPLDVKQRAQLAIGQAEVTVRQAESNLRLVQTQALTDVEKAFLAYMISRDRLRLFTSTALSNARDVRQIEQIAYNEGAKGLLDYLDAQRTYNQTLLDYNQSRFDFLSSLAQLEAATGTKLPRQ